jgi:hypothetical protein
MVLSEELVIPIGGFDFGPGVVFFYNSLPDKVDNPAPIVTSREGELYAVIDDKVYVPVEKIPLERFIKEDQNAVFLAQMDGETFMAKIKFKIELRKDTLLELFALVRARSMLV